MKKLLFLLSVALITSTALHAAFTVSANGKQVTFSQGNLQYTQSTSTWSFAENQYDMLGGDNISSDALADKIDLFGWSGSTGSVKWGISASTTVSDYIGDFVDWGTNTIGTNAPNTYRTLTQAEWNYLLNTRPNADSKKGAARIQISETEYANGLILLPDSWTCPEDVTFKSGFVTKKGDYDTHQTFTLAEWQKLEAAGAVFLPASGYRYGSSMYNVQNDGSYWSATVYDLTLTYRLLFYSYEASANTYFLRDFGQAVRLVQDIKYAITITQPEHGSIVADKTESVAGETITLTITPNDAYYAPKTVTVLQGETAIETTAVEGTTNQYTFTMPAGEVTVSAEFEKVASAFTPVAFTVSESGKQVYFSQGNLQCTLSATDTTWSFADYQTDILGTANVSGSSLADKIDLFGWSGSTGSAKWGISTSKNNSDYAGDFVDWGQNIGDGNTYRTLTNDEWNYLRYTRTNAEQLMGIARIKLNDTEYMNGLVLLPDSWTCPAGVQFTSGFSSNYSEQAYADYQIFTLAQWQQLEAAGAVLLPAMGYRNGSNMTLVKFYGYYWSASSNGSDKADFFRFHSQEATVYTDLDRSFGIAVRLVQDIKYAITITQPEHGSIVADKATASVGETVTLSVTPDTYYVLNTISVMQGETSVVTTAVEGTTDQYTFTMPAGEVTVSAEFEKIASAFTPAAFTVAANGKQVAFSQGNLQCTLSATDTTWSFAENQYDMIGEANVSNGTLANKIDLFGWSGNNTTAPWGISTSKNTSDYAGDFVDWGINAIGTAAPNTYRTLTKDEWNYLLNTRTNADSKKGVARINLNSDGSQYANGLILLPDSWNAPEGVTFTSGFSSESSIDAYATYQTFTLAEWQQLEAAGAVFLPVSGYRLGSSVKDVQYNGSYGSATLLSSVFAYYLDFHANEASANYCGRHIGQAVRLVQDLYAVTITTPEHGTIAADKTTALAGETITLTLTSAAYCTLKSFSVMQGTTAIPTAVVEGTTNQYIFTMPAGEVTVSAVFEKVSSAFTPVAFTVSESGKQVFFSQGNLQCAGVKTGNYVWSFADYQTEIIGTDNVNDGSVWHSSWGYGYGKAGTALADTTDVFGWSGSTGSAKWGIGTSVRSADYSGDFVDWGQNVIGTNAPNTYRTLTEEEWNYLRNTRTHADSLIGVARIQLNGDGSQYINGVILLPDSWTAPEGVTFKSGFASDGTIQAYADYQTFTFEEWQQLEAAGAVFLPSTGYRDDLEMFSVQTTARYWSATASDSDHAYYFDCNANEAKMGDYYYRWLAQTVRLVQDIVKYAITLTQPEHGTIVADQTEAAAGETVTLTITPDTYCTLKSFSVMQGTTVISTTAVEGTADQYTFTMPAGEVTVSAEFEKVASAFTPAAFSIADGKLVYFSQGNLQCALSATDTTWAFAEYQTEMIGTDNVTGGSVSYDEYWGYENEYGEALADKIDLFGWSGSNTTAPWGISTSTDVNDYAGDFVDWGKNTIGTNAPNTYRTLTKDEWEYLLNTRPDASDRMGVARINLNGDGSQYANGLVLLPDNWTDLEGVTFKSGFASSYSVRSYADHQTFTLAEWQKLESAGAVFLPATGYRHGAGMYEVQFVGSYRTATVYNLDYLESNQIYFYSVETGTYYGDYYYGQAVRLVQDLYAVTLTTPEHGIVTADKTYAAAGDEVTLTTTPDTGYELDVLTVQDAAGNPVTVNDNKFSMPASNVTVSATFRQTTPTAIGNTTGATDTTVRKILRNGQVLILRDGKTYTTTGIEVK